THPVLASGLPGAVQPGWIADQLADAVSKSRLADLTRLGAAYGAALAVQGMDAGLADDAVEDCRKAFSEYFPDAHPTPMKMEPSCFDRGFLGTGRASMKPTGHPRIPLASHTPDPHNLRSNMPDTSGVSKGRTFYSNAAKDE